MNKHFVYFLSFVFGLMMLSNTASAQYALSGTCGRRIQFNDDSTNLQWSVDTVQRVLTITGNGRMYDYDMDTKAPWYPWRNKIYVLSIGDGVTHIGSYAMYYLEQMDSIRWGNAVITIRENAFNHCTKLRNAIFPFNLESIESYAFYDCSNLRIVKTGNKLRTIGSYAFRYCSRIQTIDFGDAPVVIGNRSFYNSQSLKSLRGSRIKSIDNYAFYNCDSLECLFLGDSLLRINSCAFYGCHSLRGLHLPSTLTTIGGDCFAYAYVLDTITVDPANTIYNSNDNCNAVMQTSNNTLVLGCRRTIIPSLTLSIGSYAFCGCVGLQSVALPNGLVSIGNNAFNGCSSLLTVNLPNSVTTVDCDAFDNCSSLLNPIFNSKLFARLPHNYHGIYTIPESIEIVCCGAFRNCDNLTSVSVPLSVSAVKNYAFYDCDSLLSVTLPDSLASLGSYAFRNCRTLSSISIPSLVRRIESYTFENCSKLQNATLSDSLRTIDSYAFQNCTVLPSIVIPDKVTEINTFAFRYCSALTSITFPASLSRLGRGVIEGCTNLSTIIWNVKHSTISTDDTNHPFTGVRPQISNFVFGDSVRVLPGYLCYNMTNLTSLSLGCNMDSIGEKVFEGCRGIKTIYWNVRNYKDPIIYSKAPFYGIRDSVNSFIFGDSVQHIPAYICHGMSRLHKVYIPAKVSSIGDYAFRYLGVLDSISVDPANTHYDSRGGCNALMETSTNLLMLGCYKTQIPTNTQGIDAYAFRNVRNLPTVTLPPSVTFVGKEAFNGCVDLKNLTLSNNIGTINDYAFQDCDSLYGVTLPDSLWFIGLRAFANCSHIGTITLPEKVELIDQYAFSGCSSLRSITCNAPEPPVIQETTFTGTSCPIYVPCPSITDYHNAPVWHDFGTRVAGLFYNTLTVRPNDYSFGRVYIHQQPDCEHKAILEADPILGYKFVSWQDTLGNVLGVNPLYEFYLDENMSIIAEFVRDLNAIENISSQSKIWIQERDVMILSELNSIARLYDLMGHEVGATPVEAGVETSLHAPASGMYVVILDNGETQKIIIK